MKLRLLALTAVLLALAYAAPRGFSQDQGGAKPSDTASGQLRAKKLRPRRLVSSRRTPTKSNTMAARQT